jgi:NitT/TauT family transport system permease protein
MLLGSQWYVLFNVIAGAQAISADLVETAKVYGLNRIALWRTLYLPAIFPFLITGLLTAAGGAWNASIVSELVRFQGNTFVAPGLGALITQATESGDFPLLAASIILMSLALVFINRFFWRRLYRLASQRFAMDR